MKVITEQLLRLELRHSDIDTYYRPEGKILSPAAREYLQQLKIKIAKPGETPKPKQEAAAPTQEQPAPAAYKYVDNYTGAFFAQKPEHMTHLVGNRLVAKTHPRIEFRGKLDSLQSMIVLYQCFIADSGAYPAVVMELDDVLAAAREIMRAEVLDEPFVREKIIGLTHDELRERSHDPMKFYHVKQMQLPSYKMGRSYAMLNQIRSAVRETELAAVAAYYENGVCTRTDIIQGLNRLSSAMHIMMCKMLANGQG